MIIEQAVHLFSKTLDVVITKYAQGQNAIVLQTNTGYPGDYGHASVCIPDVPTKLVAKYLRHKGKEVDEKDIVYIKSWEFPDQPLLGELINAGIVEDAGYQVPTGYVYADVAIIVAHP